MSDVAGLDRSTRTVDSSSLATLVLSLRCTFTLLVATSGEVFHSYGSVVQCQS